MVQPKYDPKEALERVKLLMKYDSKKTLTENRKVILEQATPNMVTMKDLIGDTGLWGNINWKQRKGVKGVVDALDGWVDVENLQFVLNTIKGLDGKCFYDDVTQQNISATAAFVALYKEDEGDELKKDVESVGTRTLPTGAEQLKRSIIAAIDTQIAKGCASSGGGGGGGGKGGGKKDPVKYPNEGQAYPECQGGVYKKGCWHLKVKEVQGCLGVSPSYGNFGPKTAAALQAKFSDKKFYEQFVDADIPTICNKNTPEPTQPPQDTDIGSYSTTDLEGTY